ncbi:MAG: ABC transporter ATP-binding protein [Deltaproteobacteria bacterium]|nr:ABC transporter ATP-binding protein [Deltaproteobacteria bacterium]
MSLSFNLKKSFNGFTADASLSFADELFVLFGPSGAGKSLILKMISGLITPDEGTVSISGETVFDSRGRVNVPIRERRAGYLFQDYALFPHMTVAGNISYGMSHLERAEVGKRVKELLALMRLGGLEERYPHELSGGQRQRTALARTLAAGPRALLLDEPFSALDYQVREKLRADLCAIHRHYPITTVMVTHDLEEAFMLAERIGVINNGAIEQVGTREEVFYMPATRNVARFVGVKNIFDGVVTARSSQGITIHCPELGAIHAPMQPLQGARPKTQFDVGSDVTFCIRPEEVLIIRPDRPISGKAEENIIEAVITSAAARGATQTLFLDIGRGRASLKVELPNFVVRKLGLAAGRRIRVSLKKESLWVIPHPAPSTTFHY